MLGLGLGFGKLSSYKYTVKKLIDDYIKRVTAAGGYLEGNECATAKVRELNSQRLLDDASWLLIPEGIEEDIVYAQKPTDGLGDLTFTRASDATRTNSAGVIERTPWNLFEQSETFADSYWGKARGSVSANTVVAPNGTLTADVFASTSGQTVVPALFRQNVNNAFFGGRAYSFSLYAKIAGNTNVIGLSYVDNSTGFTGGSALYNLATQVVTITQSPNASVTASMQSVGDGWFRLILGFVTIASPTYNYVQIGQTTFNTGNGIALWGAQIVEGTDAKPYFATTNRQDVPRLDYRNADGTLNSCPRLLLEPQRTNLFTFSEQFNDAVWLKARCTISPNVATSPAGYLDADAVVEDTTTNSHPLYRNMTIVNATQYVASIFIKKGSRKFIRMNVTAGGVFRTYDLDTKTATNGGTIEDYGNGWLRLIYTFTSNSTFGQIYIEPLNDAGSPSYLGNGSIAYYTYGSQLEIGAYPTTYIPTTTAAVTRLADAASKTGISSLIGQAEGTLFLDFEKTNNDNTGTGGYFRIDVNNGTTSNRILFGFDLNKVNATVISGSLVALIETATTRTQERIKAAFAYKANDFVLYVNGVQIGTDTSGSVPTGLANFQWGVNQTTATTTSGVINQQAFFPTRLTNAQLAELTTL